MVKAMPMEGLYDKAAASCCEIGDVRGGVGDLQRVKVVLPEAVEATLR
jgi:hypothetical protein